MGALYCASLFGLYVGMLASYPGYTDPNFNQWEDSKYMALWGTTDALWFSLNMVSTITTVAAILKIFQNTEVLKHHNPNLKLNNTSMIVHCLMLCVQTATVLLYVLSYWTGESDLMDALGDILPFIDLLV